MLLVPGLSRRCALSNHLLRTIGFTGTEKKILSDVLGVELWHPSTKHHLYAVFFWHFTEFSIGLLYKDTTQSDCIQRCDVTISSETFGCFRNVFEQFKIYTVLTLINNLLLTKKFRKMFCMKKWAPNFIFWLLLKNVQIPNQSNFTINKYFTIFFAKYVLKKYFECLEWY